ncbi:Drug/metabolite transporter [Cynara cardunculus var. scolymus]|uniref:WAT1-related protein n=1 Tax=Cynara cardunculus var. scolymus TaxID=59895 RepID=A0A118K0N7_CYNCS|nr:Drug/metabolite transporter [Cynara cardunculus var. scolymus]
MGWFEHNKPLMAMLVLQFTYGAVSISTRASLLEGMNPRVFVVYRQAIATLAIAPISYFSRTKCCIGWKSFSLIFIAALIGITSSQMLLLEGLYLASASAGSAIFNLVPAITFFVASIVGYEPVNVRSLTTIAKILGTVLCVTIVEVMIFGFWVVCVSLVLVNKNHPDHLSLSAWMCFIATVQSATVTWFTDPNLEVWKINSYLQLGSCLFAVITFVLDDQIEMNVFVNGIVGSGISLFVQSWVIERRGPVFSAMFNPLNTVIVTIMACIFLQERIYHDRCNWHRDRIVCGAMGVKPKITKNNRRK